MGDTEPRQGWVDFDAVEIIRERRNPTRQGSIRPGTAAFPAAVVAAFLAMDAVPLGFRHQPNCLRR
jgi:hypothetical protein